MIFPGKYRSAYWRLLKAAAGLAALGVLAWGALVSLEMYQGYAELVLAIVIFAPVGTVFVINGLGILYAVLLRWRASVQNRRERCPPGLAGGVALIGGLSLVSGLFFASLSVNAVAALVVR